MIQNCGEFRDIQIVSNVVRLRIARTWMLARGSPASGSPLLGWSTSATVAHSAFSSYFSLSSTSQIQSVHFASVWKLLRLRAAFRSGESLFFFCGSCGSLRWLPQMLHGKFRLLEVNWMELIPTCSNEVEPLVWIQCFFDRWNLVSNCFEAESNRGCNCVELNRNGVEFHF